MNFVFTEPWEFAVFVGLLLLIGLVLATKNEASSSDKKINIMRCLILSFLVLDQCFAAREAVIWSSITKLLELADDRTR